MKLKKISTSLSVLDRNELVESKIEYITKLVKRFGKRNEETIEDTVPRVVIKLIEKLIEFTFESETQLNMYIYNLVRKEIVYSEVGKVTCSDIKPNKKAAMKLLRLVNKTNSKEDNIELSKTKASITSIFRKKISYIENCHNDDFDTLTVGKKITQLDQSDLISRYGKTYIESSVYVKELFSVLNKDEQEFLKTLLEEGSLRKVRNKTKKGNLITSLTIKAIRSKVGLLHAY